MLNTALPSVFEQWHTLTLRYDGVNEGIDGEAGLWGTVDGLGPEHIASGHSSRVSEARETVIEGHKKDHPKDELYQKFNFDMMNHEESFHGSNMNIYNSYGLVILTSQEAYDLYDHYSWTTGEPELEKKSWQ